MGSGSDTTGRAFWLQALSTFERQIEVTPDSGELWIHMAIVLEHLDRILDAWTAVEHGLALARQSARGWRVKGAMLGNAGQFSDALACHDRGIELDDRDWLLWQNKANLLVANGRPAEAQPCYERCLSLEEPGTPDWHYARRMSGRCLADEARLLMDARAWKEAAMAFEQALDRLDPPGSDRGLACAGLGDAFYELAEGEPGDYFRRAVVAYREALQLLPERDFPGRWVETQLNLGNALSALPGPEPTLLLAEAESCYQAVLRVCTEHGSPENWAHAQHGLAQVLLRSNGGDAVIRRAISHAEAALRVRTRERYPILWAHTMNRLGRAWSELSSADRRANLERAMACYRSVLEVSSPAQASHWAGVQMNLGNAWRDLPSADTEANLRMAIQHFEAAVQVLSESRCPYSWALAQNNLAMTWAALPGDGQDENVRKAVLQYQASLRALSEVNTPEEWARTLHNLGNAWLRLGPEDGQDAFERAAYCYSLALRVRTESDLPLQWARTQRQKASALLALHGRDRQASLSTAIECLEASLRFFTERTDPSDWAMAQYLLGQAWGDFELGGRDVNGQRALVCFNLALGVFTPEGFPVECRNVLRARQKFWFARERWTLSLEDGQAAFAVTDRIRRECVIDESTRTAIAESRATVELAFTAALRAGNPARALEVSQFGKTRRWSDHLWRKQRCPPAIEPARWEEYLAMCRNLALHRQELNRVAQPAERPGTRVDAAVYVHLMEQSVILSRRIVEKEAEFAQADPGYLPFAPPLTAEQLRHLAVRCGAILADFRVLEDRAYVLLVGPESSDPVVVELPELSRESLRSMVQEWLDACSPETGQDSQPNRQRLEPDRLCQDLDRLCRDLGEKAVEPLVKAARERWPANRRLVLSACQGLSLVPLHAAWRAEGAGRGYLFDDFEISYAPSLAVLSQCFNRHAEWSLPKTLLGVENPDGTLRFSFWEVDGCTRHFGAANQRILKGPEATAATAKQLAEGYEELLLSCHGRFDTNSPENSEFRLHGADRLRVADVLALKLDQVRLVVASACETGLTDVHDPGDEYVGLPGAFLAAGARCAIASLWSVEQVATGLLIDRFHRELHEGGLPPTAALRAAQLWLRDVGLHEVLGLMKKRQDELASQRWGGAGAPEEAIARLVLTRASLSKLGPKPFCAPLYWAAFQLVGAGW